MRDLVVLGVIVLGFATFLGAHFFLVVGIAHQRPRWHALVALIILPLAPYWGWRVRLRARSVVWMACAAVYLAARGLGAALS